MENEVDQRFINLETKMLYLEDFVSQLQKEVVVQQKLIDVLRAENKILSGKIQDLSENIEIPNRKPPHY